MGIIAFKWTSHPSNIRTCTRIGLRPIHQKIKAGTMLVWYRPFFYFMNTIWVCTMRISHFFYTIKVWAFDSAIVFNNRFRSLHHAKKNSYLGKIVATSTWSRMVSIEMVHEKPFTLTYPPNLD